MHWRLTNALDGPERPDETASAINTNPKVLRNEPQNPSKKYSALNP